MDKQIQFYQYQLNGGSMTIEQWEQDGRFDEALEQEEIEADAFDDDFQEPEDSDEITDLIESRGMDADPYGWH